MQIRSYFLRPRGLFGLHFNATQKVELWKYVCTFPISQKHPTRRRWLLQFTPKIEKFLFQDLPPLLFAENNNELGYKIASQNIPWVLLQHLFKRQFVFLPHDQNRSTDLSENHPTWKLLGVPKNYVHFRREMREEVKRNRIHTRNLFTLAAKISLGKCWGTHLSLQCGGGCNLEHGTTGEFSQKSRQKSLISRPIFKFWTQR